MIFSIFDLTAIYTAAPRQLMDSRHRIIFGNAQRMEMLASSSVNLIVTSPPYPMIEMWDATFAAMNREIAKCLPDAPMRAFELMHAELDKVWN